MTMLDIFQQAFLGLFDRFVDERRDPQVWKDAVADIHKWVTGRATRR
jgi:hypothetical protein